MLLPYKVNGKENGLVGKITANIYRPVMKEGIPAHWMFGYVFVITKS